MNSLRHSVGVSFLCAAASACSAESEGARTPSEADQKPPNAEVSGCQGGQRSSNYPEGPYGIEPGNVLKDFCLTGFSSPSNASLSGVALHDFYDPHSERGAKLLFLSGAMLWCQPCNREALQLPILAQSMADKPVGFLQVLLDGPDYGVGSVEVDLREWQTTYSLPFWSAMDPERVTEAYFPTPHPPAIIVATRNMRVLERIHGYETAGALEERLLKHLEATP